MNQPKTFDSLAVEVKRLILTVSKLEGLTVDTMGNDVTLFADGLGLDSIDLLELVVNLDRKYGLKIRNDQQGQATLVNVGSITKAILENSTPRCQHGEA